MSNERRIHSVLIDGKNLALSHGTGVASYARSLCSNLKVMNKRVELLFGENFQMPLSKNLPFVVRYPLRQASKAMRALQTAQPVYLDFAASCPAVGRLPLGQPDVDCYWNAPEVFDPPPWMVKAGRVRKVRNVMDVDAAHWTYPMPTRLEDAFNIYTLHDLVPLVLPQLTLDDKRAYFAMIKKITETASLIVTVSDQSKADIHALFKISDDRVVNTYQNVDLLEEKYSISDEALARSLEEDFGLEIGKFILFYGAVEPKKNVGRLIEAFLASNLKIPLVIAGKDGWLVEQELRPYLQHIENFARAPRILRIPYVPRRHLINLIQGASAVAFPSVYEGFGLPIAEAMSCGTPVLTSNFGAMREIAGDAAFLIDPYSTDSIRKGLEWLASDPVLRAELRLAGLARSTLFSQERYRERLSDAYSRLR